MYSGNQLRPLEGFAVSITMISVLSVLVTLLFWMILPDTFQLNENTDYMVFYEPVARNIVKGEGLTQANGAPAIIYPPGYPFILAGVFGLANHLKILEQTILSALILLSTSLTSVFVFILARSVWRPFPALLSSLVWMTYPFTLWFTKQTNSEIPFIMVFYGTFCLFWWAVLRQWHAWPIYFLIGLLIGVAMLIRPIALGAGFVMVAILWLTTYGMKMQSRWLLIMMILLGNVVAISPWEAWVYFKTGRIVLLCTNGVPSLRDGLIFGVNEPEGMHQGIDLPQDVEALMRDIHARSYELRSTGDIASILGEQLQKSPLAVAKLFAIKAARSWYGTYSQRFETPIILIQIPYLILIFCAGLLTWKQGGMAKQLAISICLMVWYFWGMTVLSATLVRYMVPAMGLLFLLLPALFQPLERGQAQSQIA